LKKERKKEKFSMVAQIGQNAILPCGTNPLAKSVQNAARF